MWLLLSTRVQERVSRQPTGGSVDALRCWRPSLAQSRDDEFEVGAFLCHKKNAKGQRSIRRAPPAPRGGPGGRQADGLRLLLVISTLRANLGYLLYKSAIPNGGKFTQSIGHVSTSGGGARSLFGLDFADAGYVWTPTLCAQDSDNDGKTNGAELGDLTCTWVWARRPI